MRLGLIGLGRHAERYLIPAIGMAKRARLAALCGRDRDRAASLSAAVPGATAYVSEADMTENCALDGVVVASRNSRHDGEVRAALSAGLAVLCEKPLAPTVAECLGLVVEAERRRAIAAVGFHLRHNPVHAKARRLVQEGVVGRVVFVRGLYVHALPARSDQPEDPRRAWRGEAAEGGALFTGSALHGIDLVRYLTGLEIEDVEVEMRSKVYSGDSGQVFDMGFGMSGGARATMTAGRAPFVENRVSVYGEAGSLHVTGSIGNVGGGMLRLPVGQGRPASCAWAQSDPYTAEIEDFAGGVLDGKAPGATFLDGLRAAEVVAALETALETRGVTQVVRTSR